MNEPKTIRVTGKGVIRLKPDTTRVTMTLEGRSKEYAETLRRSAKDTEQIRCALFEIGFSRDALKTLSFRTEPEYEGYQEDGVYKQRLIGYRFLHEMKIEFPSDHERLGKILTALADTALTPEFRISYTVKDREAAKNDLIAAAVADAKGKAAVLSKAAGVRLLGIAHIEYSMSEAGLEVRPALFAGMKRASNADSISPELVPEEITAEDTVTIDWEIE